MAGKALQIRQRGKARHELELPSGLTVFYLADTFSTLCSQPFRIESPDLELTATRTDTVHFAALALSKRPIWREGYHERHFRTFVSSGDAYSCCDMANHTPTADMVSSPGPFAVGMFIDVLGSGLWMAIPCGANTLHAPYNDSVAAAIRVADKVSMRAKFSHRITAFQVPGI